MSNRFMRPAARLLAPVRGRTFSPARRLALAGAALAATGLGWFGWRRAADAYTLEASITAVCDRLLPATGAHPGAVALGVHHAVIEEFGRRGYERHVASILSSLREADFLDLPPEARDAVLERLLDLRRDPATARVFRGLLRRTVRLYLAEPGAWPALGYDKPQPLGYPDYAACGAGRST